MVCLGSLLQLKSKWRLAVFSSGFRVLFQTQPWDGWNSVSVVCRTWVHNPHVAISRGPLEHPEAAPHSSSRGLFHFQVFSGMWNPSCTLTLSFSFATSLRILSGFKGLVIRLSPSRSSLFLKVSWLGTLIGKKSVTVVRRLAFEQPQDQSLGGAVFRILPTISTWSGGPTLDKPWHLWHFYEPWNKGNYMGLICPCVPRA